ncbi:double zinc ribbon and ankyrin repeat-containing protein 1-like [Patiria miniata]|uniref:Annexin n=1 Tax=Patiria miniata TaxID=46514 RepID=A0A914B630_PATMI|nr:double zinc ribbon and ankyrin repeat-containing protein 1-like [Patiria miniata]XP_038071686.1 double zinc ribbon and ankyrin repeat-containing protein 1-like [Patiria miniata]XP_038071687.1 double zinc ribbon and ankyrin repeat-containing protein 1-like [Patiria miniata]
MPSAGGIAAPSIIPLRVPQPGKTASQIDTNTLIEIKSETGDAIIYLTTNGSRPDPYRKADKSTIKYKGPFLLNEGRRTIKAIAVSSDRRSESHVVSKMFSVAYADPEPEPYEDDDASFIMDSRPRSALRRSHQFSDIDDVIDVTRSTNNITLSKSYQGMGNSGVTMPYNAWGSTAPPQTLATLQKNPDYMFHYHMHQQTSPRQSQAPVQYRQPPPPQPPPQTVQPPVIVDPYASSWRPVSIPLPAVLNQEIGTQTVGLFYPTHEQLGRRERDVEEVRMMRESSTSMSASAKTEKPNLMETSPGKGYWKKQLAHVVAHLEAFTQREAEFRADVGKPKMGKITSASVEDDGVDVTITISLESQTDTPAVRPNRASMARKEALLAKSLAKDSESDSPYGKSKKKSMTKKLAAKKKAAEEERLSEEDRHLFKELSPKGEGDPDNVQDLLDDGADPNSENKDGVPALVVATINNHAECLPVLIDAGAKVNAKVSSRKGNTALHEAVLLGPDGQEAIEALLEGGANAKAKNAKGETPYDLAIKNGYNSIAALFASSMGQDMLDKMSDTKKKDKGSKAKAKKKAKEEEEDSEEEFVVKKRKAYREKLPQDKGSVVAASPFDAQSDSEKLRKAMKGLGTDEKAIIEVVTHRSSSQRQKISKQFKQMFGKDLMKEFKGELGGKLLDVVNGLMMTPEKFDAYQLHKAIKGLGTDEAVLIEILCTRSNASIDAIKSAYETAYNKNLEEDVADDTSGNFQRLLVSVLQGARPEGDEVDPDKAQADAMALYKAGEDKWGTDESRFNAIMMSRSYAQLRATFEEYGKISKNDIEQAIKKEMSGDLKEGMLTVVRCVRNKHKFFADKLYKSMKGLGTDDDTLMRILISRCEVDMQNIKAEFQKAYNQTLGKFIAGDTSGDYKRIVVALVGGES